MRRVTLCLLVLVVAASLTWAATNWIWTHAERLPAGTAWIALAPVAPGLGTAVIASWLSGSYPGSTSWWVLFYAGNTLFWGAVLFSVVRLRRRWTPSSGSEVE